MRGPSATILSGSKVGLDDFVSFGIVVCQAASQDKKSPEASRNDNLGPGVGVVEVSWITAPKPKPSGC